MVLVTASFDGSIPGSLEYRSSSAASDSNRLLEVENCLKEGRSRSDSNVVVGEARARAQGVRSNRGSDILTVYTGTMGGSRDGKNLYMRSSLTDCRSKRSRSLISLEVLSKGGLSEVSQKFS